MPIDQSGWMVFGGIYALLIGGCIGSFLNVCIYRIPADVSVVAPRSNCPRCHALIAWYDNIPWFSYLALRGRCRHCRQPISSRYFWVETLTAVLFLAVWLKFGSEAGTRPLGLAPITQLGLVPVYWLGVAGLVLATFVDLDHMIIPDRVSIGGIVAGIALSALLPSMHAQTSSLAALMRSAGGAAAGFFSLWGVAILGRLMFKKEAMGFGDVKLLGAMGAFFGWRAVIFIIMMSSLVGSIVGVSLIASRRTRLQARIPYGPFLALAAILWLLWGPAWWAWYAGLLAPDHLPH